MGGHVLHGVMMCLKRLVEHVAQQNTCKQPVPAELGLAPPGAGCPYKFPLVLRPKPTGKQSLSPHIGMQQV